MRIFVTGANGFVGREFCRLALARGHQVLGLHRASGTKLADGCQSAHGSLAEPPWDIVDAFHPDTALHLAWITTPGGYLDSPENETLVRQSESLFHGLRALGVRYIAGTGTGIEYAPSDKQLLEDSSPLKPLFAYSRAKVETCLRLKRSSEETQTPWSWFRLFYPYGEGEHPLRLPTALMRKLMRGEAVELKTPDSVKDYIHVSDAAEAILTSIELQLQGPVNIGTGTGVKILDMTKTIAQIGGFDPGHITRATSPNSEVFSVTVADTKKLRHTGWRPKVRLEEGLEQLWQSLQINFAD